MDIKQSITKTLISKAVDYISGDPEKNLPKLLKLIEGFGWTENQLRIFDQIVNDHDNVWHKIMINMLPCTIYIIFLKKN